MSPTNKALNLPNRFEIESIPIYDKLVYHKVSMKPLMPINVESQSRAPIGTAGMHLGSNVQPNSPNHTSAYTIDDDVILASIPEVLSTIPNLDLDYLVALIDTNSSDDDVHDLDALVQSSRF